MCENNLIIILILIYNINVKIERGAIWSIIEIAIRWFIKNFLFFLFIDRELEFFFS